MYRKTIEKEYVFSDILLEDSLIKTGNENRYLVPDVDDYAIGEVYALVKETLGEDGYVIDYECQGGYVGYDYAIEELQRM